MRRLLLSLVAGCFLGALAGCHTAGICDCDPFAPCGPACPGAGCGCAHDVGPIAPPIGHEVPITQAPVNGTPLPANGTTLPANGAAKKL